MSLLVTSLMVVSYSISTSNHNHWHIVPKFKELYLIPFLHQTTTMRAAPHGITKLYLIPFLHQTTTKNMESLCASMLYLIPFLHQTTTETGGKSTSVCCILFHFYIKPQPMAHKTLFSSTLSPKSHSHFQRNAVV